MRRVQCIGLQIEARSELKHRQVQAYADLYIAIVRTTRSVSYTHLTLPTIYSV